MPEPAVRHPSPDQLAAFGLGQLDEAASAAVETHLNLCDSCRTAVEDAPPDSLVLALRDPARTEQTTGAAPAPECPAELTNHPRYRVLGLIGSADPALGTEPPHLYATTVRWRTRPRRRPLLESWFYPLAVGRPLPPLPIGVDDDLGVTLDLEASYEDTCRLLRITDGAKSS